MDEKIDTKKQILDIAEDLLLDRGYNGFSYKDISGALNIKNASIHYHFPKKTDLGVAIIQRASNRFQKWAGSLDSKDLPSSKKLDEFCLIFKKFVEQKQVCLGGALETDFKTLPEEMQEETRLFMSTVFQWLESFLMAGKKKGELNFPGTAKDQALLTMASLQGAIQIVRVTSPASFDATVKQIKRYVCA
ncbi:MAG: TetR/AcrR family transcriptional regulator [Smithellaceae bacterium]|nr:TetR/AcrR family transcriptional regulator [Smithellaceae bacterium]